MAPAEDTTGHWENYIPTHLDDLHPASPLFFGANQTTHFVGPSSRDLSNYHTGMSSITGSNGHPHSGSMDRDSDDKYAASGYASTSFIHGPTRTNRRTGRHRSSRRALSFSPPAGASFTECYPSSTFVGFLDAPEVPNHVGIKLQTPPSPSQSLWAEHLPVPPIQNCQQFVEEQDHGLRHRLSPENASEGSLSPLSCFQTWTSQEPSCILPSHGYESALYANDWGHPHESGGSPPIETYQVTDNLPNHCHCTSPDSFDTDLDDESSMSSSTSSLSPDYLDAELRHASLESEDDDDDHDSPPDSPLMYLDVPNHLYPLEKYPMPSNLYHSHLHNSYDDAELPPLSPPSPVQDRPPEPKLQLASPQEDHPTFGLGLSPFPDPSRFYAPFYSHFDDVPMTVPSSPSRRRSTDLPSFDEDEAFGPQDPHDLSLLKSPQRATWLSLPGAEADDDLIPTDLASKNYIPDPTITVPTTPPSSSSGGLLIWDPDGNDTTLRPPRSPSPEDFQIDPSIVAELAGEEGERVYRLRQRTAKKDSWERERYGELSALLRLKLNLDERSGAPGRVSPGGEGVAVKTDDSHQSSQSLPKVTDTTRSLASHSTSSSAGTATATFTRIPTTDRPSMTSSRSIQLDQAAQFSEIPGESGPNTSWSSSSQSLSISASSPTPSVAVPSFLSSAPSPVPAVLPAEPQNESQRHASTPHPYSFSHKPKITSMAQLVANMVFHRQQQETARKKPPRSRTWEPASSSGVGAHGLKTHPTPRSPLRQVLIPEEMEESEGEGDGEGVSSITGAECESPLPLSPLCLSMSPLPLFSQLLPEGGGSAQQ